MPTQRYTLVGLGHPYILPLDPGLNRVGRNPTNDVRIHDATVSSFHCEIDVGDDRILLTDLGSTNGTFVDDAPVQEAILEPGQRIGLGDLRFRIEAQPLDPVQIRVPELSKPELAAPTFLDDGIPSCNNHRDTEADFRCPRCSLTFCKDCVHTLRVASGPDHSYCPACSAECTRIESARRNGAARKPSILANLTETIRLLKWKR